MNVLYVTGDDIRGQNFNGYLLQKALLKLGHNSHMSVMMHGYNEPEIHQVGNRLLRRMDYDLFRLERKYSYYSILPVSALSLYTAAYYRNADIVHLQLVHTMPFFSLFNVPLMSRQHQVVWTMHDPWLMTGHCVYSLDCSRWLIGCGICPDLQLPIPLRQDKTANNWKIKNWVMHHSNVTLVVASQWMLDRVKQSPILSHLPCHLIPFGVDTGVFKPRDKVECKARFGIPKAATVLAFRTSLEPKNYKGVEYIEQALGQWNPNSPVCLLTFEGKGGLESIRGRFPFVELGWVKDQQMMAEALCAADVFLMPSIAEAFGMMAVEAIACGTPVITFEGTSVPDIIHAPIGGITVTYQDAQALVKAIDKILSDRSQYQSLVENGIQIVRKEYTHDRYINQHMELYESLLSESN